MKRDAKGKFVHYWDSETKRRVSLSLTKTAWRSLDQEARRRGTSRSELVEQMARSLNTDWPLQSPPISTFHTATAAHIGLVQAETLAQQPALVTVDRDWRYTSVTQAAAAILCKTPDELLGKPIWDEFPERVGGVAYQAIHRAAAEQIPVFWEECGQSGQRWLEVNAYPSTAGITLYFRDITERKQAEAERERLLQELETERTRFEAVLQQMPAGVLIADAASGQLSLANEQANVIVGYGYESSLEQENYKPITPFAAFRWDGRRYAARDYPLARSLQTGAVISNEVMELRQPDGNSTVISVNSAPIRNRQGQIVAAVVVFQDVTQFKRTQDTLRQTEERLQLALSSAQLIAWDMDLTTNRVVCSPKALEIWGLQEGTGDDFFAVIHPEDQPQVRQAAERAITGEPSYAQQYRVIGPDGILRWVNSLGRVYCDHAGRGIRMVGVSFDTTERNQIEVSQAQARQQIEQLLAELQAKERQQQFLIELNDAIRAIQDSQEIMWQVVSATGKHFNVTRCTYGEIDPTQEYVSVDRDFCQGVISIQGRHHLDSFGRELITALKQGQTIVVDDVNTDPRTAGSVAAFSAIQTQSLLCVPLVKAGRFVALLVLHQVTPRAWTQEAVILLERIAQKTWLAVERSRAEEALRESEAHLQLALKSGRMGTWDWEIQTGAMRWSEGYFTMFGLVPNSLQPSHEVWASRVHPDDLAKTEAKLQLAMREHHEYYEEYRLRWPDGSIHWIEARGQFTYDTQGNPKQAIGAIIDVTARKQAEQEREQLLAREQAAREQAEAAEQRARFLTQVSTVFTASLSYEQTLKSVAQLVVPILADWCVVDILKVDNSLERLAIAHVDPAKAKWAAEVHRRYPANMKAAQGIANVLRTGQSESYAEITDEQLAAGAQDDTHLTMLQELGLKSLMIVPLIAREAILGTISFVYAESGRAYTADDLTLAEELAHRAAIALDNAWLYHEAQQAQQTAEQAANRTTRLQGVTAALSESLTPVQVADVVVDQSLTALEADAVLVVLLTDDRTELEIVRAVGYQQELIESWKRFSINAAAPLAEAVRTGKPFWAASASARLEAYPQLTDIYGRYDYESWMSLPLVAEGKSVGGMLLSFKAVKELSQDDRDFTLALTQQCAQAIVRSQLYEAERQARTAAERANRIKDEFLAVLSHELRSPLNPILGWSKLLRMGRLDRTKTEQALETIERNAKLQAQLIEDLLDVSRILQGKLTLNAVPVNLAATIEAALETVQLAADTNGIQIQTHWTPLPGTVLGDTNRLQQVVWNLLSNAVKFSPSGGRVEVRLEPIETRDAREQGSSRQDDRLSSSATSTASAQYAQITIRDTGKGIRPEFLPHVFEYFRQEDGTTTRHFGGLGLGLAIARHLTELHGGTIWAESPGLELGSTFTVRLPLTRVQQTHPAAALTEPTLHLAQVRILVVDDDADMRELAAFSLTQAGAEVTTAASGTEALHLLTQSLPDLLLCDIGMPEMDGYALMRTIRASAPSNGSMLPAIALTAYAGEINQQQALAAGFQRHITKPVEPQSLINAIAALIAPKGGITQE